MKLKQLLLKGIALCVFIAAIDFAQAYSVTNVTGNFVIASTNIVGNEPLSIVAADVNGDGKVDLICANYQSSTLMVLTNNGSGSFVLAQTLSVANYPNTMAAADLNGDGKADLVCASWYSLNVFINNGSGRFTLSSSPGLYFVSAITLADINGDGKPDIVCEYNENTSLAVLVNNGSGGFTSGPSPDAGGVPTSIAAADVNGDGKVDLICADYYTNKLTVLTNNGTGGFALSVSYPMASPYSVAAADVNGDGKVDLICANPTTLTVLTNNGSGGFVVASTPSAGNGPQTVMATDVNGDGKADLICANSTTITVLTNNGSGSFVVGSSYTNNTGYNSGTAIAAADVNGDNGVDVIFANDASLNTNPGNLTILTNVVLITYPPLITGFSPTNGVAGTSVTITGVNLASTTNVLFNGSIAVFSINSGAQITATVPTSATTGYVTVLGTNGIAISTNLFYVLPPGITGFLPASGVAGTSVTITGTNFAGVTNVTFNATPAAFLINSSSQITATVPSCAGSGVITVFSAAGNSSSSSNFIFARPPVTLSSTGEASLDYAICNDSNITFSVSGTIGITSQLVISSDITLDGTGQNVTINGNNSVGIFAVNPGVHLTLKNLTIANGQVSSVGAAIYNYGGIVTVQNCTFSNNVAIGSSGGINGAGGAIGNVNGGTVAINGSTFVTNIAIGGIGGTGSQGSGQYGPGGTGGRGGDGLGGAIYNSGIANLFITNCTFYGNLATGGAGGTGGRGYNGYQYFVNTGFGNGYWVTVYGGPGGQGGIGGNAYGGNICNEIGSLMVVNDTFSGGSVTGGGPGSPGSSGNYGSGNYGYGSSGIGEGGNVDFGTGQFTFLNTIVANPVQGGNYWAGTRNVGGGTITDGGNNLSSDATLAFTNSTSFTNTNPNLGSLTNNGGTTWTMALLPGSPAIDAGQTIPGLTTDQRGLPRPYGSAFDIGAYEFQFANIGIDAGLRAYDGAAIIKFACEGPGSTNSALRFSKNGTNYGILLTATNSANASKFRIQTASGTKAFMKLP